VQGVRKPIIGLAGGIGSGKSLVARLLGELGAAVIDSDALNACELNDPEVVRTLRDWWGKQVAPDGKQLDREAVARIVFDSPHERKRLEALLHPRIARRRAQLMERYGNDPNVRAIVLDSPLLFEAGLDAECTCVLFVEAAKDKRLERIRQERGWSAEELERRENSQKPLDFKRSRADYIIDNNSTIDALRPQVEKIFSEIVSRATPS